MEFLIKLAIFMLLSSGAFCGGLFYHNFHGAVASSNLVLMTAMAIIAFLLIISSFVFISALVVYLIIGIRRDYAALKEMESKK